MEWLGHANITFTHSPNPLKLTKKDGTATDLLALCEESTPPCHLNPFLFNGHMQTMWTVIKNDGPPVYYKRKLFEAENPTFAGSFAVDFVVPKNSDIDDTLPIRTTYFNDAEFEGIGSLDSKPMLVVLHGLSGGSYEIYLNSAQRQTNLQKRPVTPNPGPVQVQSSPVHARPRDGRGPILQLARHVTAGARYFNSPGELKYLEYERRGLSS